MKTIVYLFFVFSLISCASQKLGGSPYGPIGSSGYGFAEEMDKKVTDKSHWGVYFIGNKNTGVEVLDLYATARASEIAARLGYAYFVVEDYEITETHPITGGKVNGTVVQILVRLHKTYKPNAYSTREVLRFFDITPEKVYSSTVGSSFRRGL